MLIFRSPRFSDFNWSARRAEIQFYLFACFLFCSDYNVHPRWRTAVLRSRGKRERLRNWEHGIFFLAGSRSQGAHWKCLGALCWLGHLRTVGCLSGWPTTGNVCSWLRSNKNWTMAVQPPDLLPSLFMMKFRVGGSLCLLLEITYRCLALSFPSVLPGRSIPKQNTLPEPQAIQQSSQAVAL